MKKSILLLIIMLSVFCSCSQKEAKLDATIDDAIVQSRNSNQSFISFNLPFPEGTYFEIVESVLYFSLPEKYYLVGLDEKGNYHRSAPGGSGSVTCECTEGSGCDPIRQGNDVGCLMKDGCSKCTKSSVSIIGVYQDLVDIIIMHPESSLFISDFSQIENQYFLPGSFLDYLEFENILNEIRLSQSKMPESDRKIVFINAHGYILPIELKLGGDNVSIVSEDISCSCNVSGSCPKKKHWSGVVWCDSDDCTKCTMSGLARNSAGVEKFFSSATGKITLK